MKMEEIDVSDVHATLIDHEDNGQLYNLNGTKVEGITVSKGIYIKNGKKIVIK